MNNGTDIESLIVVHPMPIILKCPVYADPPPEINWYKDGGLLEMDDNVFLKGQELRIKKSRSNYSGNYSCLAENPAGNFTKLFTVKVIGKLISAFILSKSKFDFWVSHVKNFSQNF